MENKRTVEVKVTNLEVCPQRVLEEIRETAIMAAQMKGFLAGEKVIRAGLHAWPHLIDEEMSRLKKIFCWNKYY